LSSILFHFSSSLPLFLKKTKTKNNFLESLLLLIALTTSNTEIQKIVAFEGAFDRLLAIIYEV